MGCKEWNTTEQQYYGHRDVQQSWDSNLGYLAPDSVFLKPPCQNMTLDSTEAPASLAGWEGGPSQKSRQAQKGWVKVVNKQGLHLESPHNSQI